MTWFTVIITKTYVFDDSAYGEVPKFDPLSFYSTIEVGYGAHSIGTWFWCGIASNRKYPNHHPFQRRVEAQKFLGGEFLWDRRLAAQIVKSEFRAPGASATPQDPGSIRGFAKSRKLGHAAVRTD